MINIKAPNSINNALRPMYYISKDGTWPDGEDRVLEALRGKTGSILLPEGDMQWRHHASWAADTLIFWFAKGDADQGGKLLELGIHVGRYVAGFGANKMIIGAHEKFAGIENLRKTLDAANTALHGKWRFRVITNFQEFIRQVQAS